MRKNNITECFKGFNFNHKDSIEALQRALTAAGYTANKAYCDKYTNGKPDGVVGDKTRADIVNYIKDNPTILLEINPSLTQHLYNKGFGITLERAAQSDAGLEDQLRGEIDCILDGRALSELNKNELKTVQQNWKVLGEYDGKIDGLNGPLTKAALKKHKPPGCQPRQDPVEHKPKPAPQPNIAETPAPEVRTTVPKDWIWNQEFGDFVPPSGPNGHIKDDFNAQSSGSTKGLRLPITGAKITSDFGPRTHYKPSPYHKSIDLQAPSGTPYMAAGDGVVSKISNRLYRDGKLKASGRYVVISHSKNVHSCYMHSDKIALRVGDKVKAGDYISQSAKDSEAGSTSSASHIDFSIVITGKCPKTGKIKAFNVDPEKAMALGDKIHDPKEQALLIADSINKYPEHLNTDKKWYSECKWFSSISRRCKPEHYGKIPPSTADYADVILNKQTEPQYQNQSSFLAMATPGQ